MVITFYNYQHPHYASLSTCQSQAFINSGRRGENITDIIAEQPLKKIKISVLKGKFSAKSIKRIFNMCAMRKTVVMGTKSLYKNKRSSGFKATVSR